MDGKFDIAVIGGGHAGIEAANAAAKLGAKTALISISLRTMGAPSCNPSIGGAAKGHLVKEIDALGGAMGRLADLAGIQFKMLNRSKGPAVWSPRAQIDKDLYPRYVFSYLYDQKNLTLVEDSAGEIIIKNDKVRGLITERGETIYADAVIITAGTFLNGLMFVGDRVIEGGRYGEPPSKGLSDKLKDVGFEVGRLKTGTPPRVYKDTIDYSKLKPALGDEPPQPFSYKTAAVENRALCYMTATSEKIHDILRTGFDRSPLFQGVIKGVGPRYCPSIEDKVERFPDRSSHKILLEPEGLNSESVYVNGFSTSLPADVQEKGLRELPGMRRCKIIRYGYAIEYDYFPSSQLKPTLETKLVEGLYFAGQVNGTSGYEEAAAQGLAAGVNAALKLRGKGEFVLKRSEAYIGVLIDDLITKTVDEPYRIFTSSAEYRLLLRQDNAYRRLFPKAARLGLISKEDYEKFLVFEEKIEKANEKIRSIKIKREKLEELSEDFAETQNEAISIRDAASRNSASLKEIIETLENPPKELRFLLENEKARDIVQNEIKYEGYVKRQEKEIAKFLEAENKKIPTNLDYAKIGSLSNEAREKLSKFRPVSLGQASRIAGVSPADISILALYLKI